MSIIFDKLLGQIFIIFVYVCVYTVFCDRVTFLGLLNHFLTFFIHESYYCNEDRRHKVQINLTFSQGVKTEMNITY